MFALEPVIYKAHSKSKLPSVRRELALVFARMEVLLPLYLNTICKHQLYEGFTAKGSIMRGGPSSVTNMLKAEQFQTVMKKLAQSRKNLNEGIARAYECVEEVEHLRLLHPALFTSKAPSSSVSAQLSPDRDAELVVRLGQISKDEIMDIDSDLYDRILFLWHRECPVFSRLVMSMAMQLGVSTVVALHGRRGRGAMRRTDTRTWTAL